MTTLTPELRRMELIDEMEMLTSAITEVPLEVTEVSHSLPISTLVDARGSYCPAPLMELISVLREVPIGVRVTLRTSDRGARVDVPRWLEKAGQRLVAVERLDGYDEIVVQKVS